MISRWLAIAAVTVLLGLPACSKSARIVGSWKDENSTLQFLENGGYVARFDDGRVSAGSWKIDGDTLTIAVEGNTTFIYQVVTLTSDSLDYRSLRLDRDYHAHRLK